MTPSDASPPDNGHSFFKAGGIHPFFCGIGADTHGLGGLLLSNSWLFGNQINKFPIGHLTTDPLSGLSRDAQPQCQQVQQNIDAWFKHDIIRRCNNTFSILNIWDCDRIMAWCDKRFALGNVNYNWVEQPAMYNAVNMPEDMKHHIMKSSTYWRSRQVLPNMFTQAHNPKLWSEFKQRAVRNFSLRI